MKLYQAIKYFISMDLLWLHSYINALTCTGYLAERNHSTKNVHVTATCCIRRLPFTDLDWAETVTERPHI